MALLPRLKKRSEFLRVSKKRNSFATSSVIAQVFVHPNDYASNLQNATPGVRIGFTASRKVGGAVVRNRAKRRLREAIQLASSALALPPCDVVLIARRATASVSFQKLVQDCLYAITECLKREQQ